MKDANGNRVLGKTRWRRFGLAYGISMGVIMGVLLLAATGAIAIPLTITGLPFTVEGDALHGQNFSQYATLDACDAVGPFSGAFCTSNHVGVAITSIGTLTNATDGGIMNLTQTVCGPTGLPGSLATLKLKITVDTV